MKVGNASQNKGLSLSFRLLQPDRALFTHLCMETIHSLATVAVDRGPQPMGIKVRGSSRLLCIDSMHQVHRFDASFH